MCKQLGKGAVADLVARGIPHRTIDRIKDVMPAQICYVLENHGWQEVRSYKPNTRVWQKGNACGNTFHQVTVPYDKNDEDYEMVLASAVYSLYLCGGIPLDAILENGWQENNSQKERLEYQKKISRLNEELEQVKAALARAKIGGRHKDVAREARIQKYKQEHPDTSIRKIAKILGCSYTTVRRALIAAKNPLNTNKTSEK